MPVYLGLGLLLGWCLVSPASAQTSTTGEVFEQDRDFQLQGEYVDSARGLQVIALGDDEFQVISYADGLPGAGWNQNQQQQMEVDIDQLEAMLDNFDPVSRQSPTLGAAAPAGAIQLFDGTEQSAADFWNHPRAKMTDDGLLTPGGTTKDAFGDYLLHVEFRTPFPPSATDPQRDYCGILHQNRYESRILDSFGLDAQVDHVGGLVDIRGPDLNMCLPPMAWQTYDAELTAARWKAGKRISDASITVKLNGVVVQRDILLPPAGDQPPSGDGPETGPLVLVDRGAVDRGNAIRFRNIWLLPRDLDAEAKRPLVPAFERFHANIDASASGGRLLMGELGCAACHQADLAGAVTPIKQAPILDDVGKRLHPQWMIDYLSDPHAVKPGTTMPDVMAGMDPSERRVAAVALTHFLVGKDQIEQTDQFGDLFEGQRLFHQSGCIACHAPRNGVEVSAATSVPLPDLAKKYSVSSLARFLDDPLKVRVSGRMPQLNLGKQGSRDVANYLIGHPGQQNPGASQPNLNYAVFEGEFKRIPDFSKRTPDKQGTCYGLDLSVADGRDQVAVRFDGYLPIQRAGTYHFALTSDDGSRLLIDGEPVVDNDRRHNARLREESLSLAAGIHKIEVQWFQAGGQQRLSLQWSGPNLRDVALDSFFQLSSDFLPASAPENKPQNQSVDFAFDQSLVPTGRRLFQSLGCASCHVRHDQGGRLASRSSAPPLSQCDPSRGCLSKQPTAFAKSVDRSGAPPSSISADRGDALRTPVAPPHYDLVGTQRTAIATALVSASASAVAGDDAVSAGAAASAGDQADGDQAADDQAAGDQADGLSARLVHTMKSLNCYACHERRGIGGPESDRNPLFVSASPEMGDEGRLPPPLDGVGDKLRQSWIKHVITSGQKNRPYMQTHMPGFGGNNADQLSALFAKIDLIDSGQDEPADFDPPEHLLVSSGRKLVGSEGLACVACHTYGKFKSTGIQAIALDTMTQRIREDWFRRYLPEPQVYRPGTRMPTGFRDGKSTVQEVYDGDQSKQLSAIWTYLTKGSRGGTPKGYSSGLIELAPVDRPVIYRNFIEGVSPRAIAVGYPQHVNLCWDADLMALRLLWQDRFIDASKHWVGRGQGDQSPLGGPVVKLEDTAPLAILPDSSAAWPSKPPRQRAFKFLGYQLDGQGQPAFGYRTPWAVVEDQPRPVRRDLAGVFDRQIKISDFRPATQGTAYFRAARGTIQPIGPNYLLNGVLEIRIESDQQPILRQSDGASELLVPITSDCVIQQSLVW